MGREQTKHFKYFEKISWNFSYHPSIKVTNIWYNIRAYNFIENTKNNKIFGFSTYYLFYTIISIKDCSKWRTPSLRTVRGENAMLLKRLDHDNMNIMDDEFGR